MSVARIWRTYCAPEVALLSQADPIALERCKLLGYCMLLAKKQQPIALGWLARFRLGRRGKFGMPRSFVVFMKMVMSHESLIDCCLMVFISFLWPNFSGKCIRVLLLDLCLEVFHAWPSFFVCFRRFWPVFREAKRDIPRSNTFGYFLWRVIVWWLGGLIPYLATPNAGLSRC